MENKSSSPRTKPPKAYSCVRCFERKVKCDKQHPCSACLRTNVDCIFRARAAPRRPPRQVTDEAVLARLKYYEDLLRENGIDLASPSATLSEAETTSPPHDAHHFTGLKSNKPLFNPNLSHGKLIVDNGKSRFIENKLWTSVSQEFRHKKDIALDGESEEEMDTPTDDSIDFVLGMTPSANQTFILHPSPDHLLKLWQIFLTNVNPMTKIIHQPSLQLSIEKSIPDLEHMPRGLEALLFAIYGAAVHSMRDGECQATFGEPRSTLQARYRLGVRRSLTKAQFMRTSDLMVLQAFVIYLLTMRQDLDTRTLWTLSGVANRIAHGMGVHRDGTILSLSPFETEMRSRIWWQINIFDSKAAELCGYGSLGDVSWWNSKSPSNVNDVDIWPGMKEPPTEHKGPTEMIACLLRYEISIFWRRKLLDSKIAEQDLTRAVQSWVATATILERDNFIDAFEEHLEGSFLKHCDQSIPVQMMASFTARMVCNSMRILAHHPRQYAYEKDMPDSERRFLWKTSMALIEMDNLVHSYHSLQKFNWHIDVDFQWQALIYVLGELMVRPTGDGKDDAWSQVENIFKNHPNFISNHKKPLHTAIGNMCLKAWGAREKAQLENPQGSSWLDTPAFILQLRKQKEVEEEKAKAKRYEASQMNLISQSKDMDSTAQPQLLDSSIMPDIASVQQFQPGNTSDSSWPPDFSVPMMDDMGMDWETWDNLLHDLQVPTIPPSMSHSQFPNMDQYMQQGYL